MELRACEVFGRLPSLCLALFAFEICGHAAALVGMGCCLLDAHCFRTEQVVKGGTGFRIQQQVVRALQRGELVCCMRIIGVLVWMFDERELAVCLGEGVGVERSE